MHADAAQSVGKIPVDVDALGIDLLTIAGHKRYAPKGVGALYVRHGTVLAPVLTGAGHERGLRPGTENVPGIVALGKACEVAERDMLAESMRLSALRDELLKRLRAAVPGLVLHGHPTERLPNTLFVSFPGAAGSRMLELARLAIPGRIRLAPRSLRSACRRSKRSARCVSRLVEQLRWKRWSAPLNNSLWRGGMR